MKNFINKIINWIKGNKLTTVLILVVLYLFMGRRGSPVLLTGVSRNMGMGVSEMALDSVSSGSFKAARVPSYEAAPQPGITDRKVITRSAMSLQVKDVREVMDNIKLKVRELEGYVVDTNVTTPEFGEEGSIVIRIPANDLDDTLAYFRELSIKVVSENISGSDITDEYMDVEKRIDRLENTKARFEEILDKAEKVEDILRVQREIFNLQDQIDNYKGQLKYMEGASSTTLIRIYLSTDELGLPYAPSQAWRPAVVFKQASRSLLLNLVKVGNAAIWGLVYLPIIALAAFVYILVKRVRAKKIASSQN